MEWKLPTLPIPHKIITPLLLLLLAISFYTHATAGYALYVFGLFVVMAASHALWKKGLKSDIFLRDSIASFLIIVLLLEPATTFREAIPAVVVVLASVLLRKFARYKALPIFNPAASAILLAILISYTGWMAAPLVSWWGTNFSLHIGSMSLPVGTAVSFILFLLLATRLQKWWYALAFFLSFGVLAYLASGVDAITATLLDGTIYFFFAVMACEPKTVPVTRRQQIVVGIVLALVLAASTKYPIPSEHIIAILVANLATFGLKNVPFLKERLG